MLCSVCKKNMAVVFINSLEKDGKSDGKVKGLCLECAQKQGINPLSNIIKEISSMSEEEMEDMSNQFNEMLNNMGGMPPFPVNNEDENINDDENKNGFFDLSKMFAFSKFFIQAHENMLIRFGKFTKTLHVNLWKF